MTPTFACGMGYPWAPEWWRYPVSPVIQQAPRCEHCFCEDEPYCEAHLRCCKCGTRMAEKFVRAWFEILSSNADSATEAEA